MDRDTAGVRRSVVPQAASRSLWLAAAWTGAGAAVVGAITAIGVVAICWLPAANGSGSAGSAIRAGVLTFLAALHGGITVDGLPASFVPLGMTVIVAALAWRAGRALADAAEGLGEQDVSRLVRAVFAQTAVFAAICAAAAHFAALGTSRVSALAAACAGAVLFGCAGGLGFVRSSSLAAHVRERIPTWIGSSVRAAAVGLAVYLGAGALLVAGSLVIHHQRVEQLSHQIGGGWSGVPILLLGILAAPNAAIAGAAYLSGPGFAVGAASSVSLGSTVHGTMPAFPLLGALPDGPAGTPAWLMVAATPFVAGVCAARVVSGTSQLLGRLRAIGVAAAGAALAALGLAWLGGGAIGSGQLSVVGASPWQFGLGVGAALGVVGAVWLCALAALAWLRGNRPVPAADRVTLAIVPGAVAGATDDHDAGKQDSLAG